MNLLNLMNPVKAITSALNDTTNMVNAGNRLGCALGFKPDRHHDIYGGGQAGGYGEDLSYLRPGKFQDIR